MRRMTQESYERIFGFLNERGIMPAQLKFLGNLITLGTAVCYFAVTALLLRRLELVRAAGVIGVPAVSFVLVSILRNQLHAKRPYEIYGFKPLVPKETKEKSFPSRHVFSIFVIGTSLFWVNSGIGLSVLAAGVLLALLRVCIGVHFPEDVAAGAALGIFFGLFTGLVF